MKKISFLFSVTVVFLMSVALSVSANQSNSTQKMTQINQSDAAVIIPVEDVGVVNFTAVNQNLAIMESDGTLVTVIPVAKSSPGLTSITTTTMQSMAKKSAEMVKEEAVAGTMKIQKMEIGSTQVFLPKQTMAMNQMAVTSSSGDFVLKG